MTEQTEKVAKGDFTAVVYANKQIRSCFWRLSLHFSHEGAKTFSAAKPGQFCEIDLSGTALPPADRIPEQLLDATARDIILRRPFSFCDVISKDDKATVDIIYCVVGPASIRMTTIKPEEKIRILGPLGNGFSIRTEKKHAVLIAGGMGAPPIQHLGKVLGLQYPDIHTMTFAGARTRSELPFEGRIDEISEHLGYQIPAFAKVGVESQIATDDGSLGYSGLVTNCFVKWMEENNIAPEETAIYSCGPEQMLAAVAKIANEKNIECQISMERRMACGIGLCQGCTVECKSEGAYETDYKLCCKDGPVFDAKEVVFEFEQGGHKL